MCEKFMETIQNWFRESWNKLEPHCVTDCSKRQTIADELDMIMVVTIDRLVSNFADLRQLEPKDLKPMSKVAASLLLYKPVRPLDAYEKSIVHELHTISHEAQSDKWKTWNSYMRDILHS